MNFTMKLRSKVLYFSLLMVAMGFLNAQTVEQTAPPVGPKMDEVPPNYSVLVEFDQGGVLLVPWFLVPEREIPKNRDEKVKESWLQMVFRYPDMRATYYPSGMDEILEKSQNRYVPKPDEFPVILRHLLYLPKEDLSDTGNRYHHYPSTTFKEIQMDFDVTGKLNGIKNTKILPYPSTYSGLQKLSYPLVDPVSYERRAKEYKERGGKHDFDAIQTIAFIAASPSSYDLFLACTPVTGSSCTAEVFDKETKYRYDMEFHFEAIAHADDLIRKTNSLIATWAKMANVKIKSMDVRK